MARTPEWEKLEMAEGDPNPAWPLPTVPPKFATWSVGGGRPYGCTLETCKRWHAGIDLTGAPDGAVILAPEDALVLGLDRGWDDNAKAAFLRTKTGLFLVLGGFRQGSHKEFGVGHGQVVKKGERLGRIHGPYGMIHLELYQAEQRTANSVWWKGEPPPAGLLNPTHYVERMVGDRVSLLQTRQRHEALAALGFFKGDVAAEWSPASTEALRAAQASLGIRVDGKWGPQTEDAIGKALAERQGCSSGECATEAAAPAEGASTDALAPVGRIGWWALGGVALASVGVGLALSLRRRA
jgi:hypothetical protein